MGRIWMVLGAFNAFLSVALGAFGAHGLRGHISERLLTVYHTGVEYQMSHALALFALGIWLERNPRAPFGNLAAALLLTGIVLFSGSLYLLAVTGNRSLGIVTPIGGVCFLTGWAVVVMSVLRARR